MRLPPFKILMMDKIFGRSNIDVIKDPFNKESITGVHIEMEKNFFSGDFDFTGRVYFRNGQTQGLQRFEGDNLGDVFIKVKNFCVNLR